MILNYGFVLEATKIDDEFKLFNLSKWNVGLYDLINMSRLQAIFLSCSALFEERDLCLKHF